MNQANRSVFVLQSSRVTTLRYNAPANTERKCQQHDNEMTARKTRYTQVPFQPWGTRDTILYTRTKSVGTSQHQFKVSVTNHLFINPFISHSTIKEVSDTCSRHVNQRDSHLLRVESSQTTYSSFIY